MEKGVEVRFPYLNEQLKSLINSMPLKDKVDKKLVDKILLRKIAKKLVPKNLQSEKLPFGLPAVRKKHFGLSKTKFEKPAFNDLFYQNYKKMRKMVLFGKFRKLKLFNNNFLKEIVIRQSEKKTNVFLTSNFGEYGVLPVGTKKLLNEKFYKFGKKIISYLQKFNWKRNFGYFENSEKRKS